MLDRITFGITSFERPRLLERLVASIRRRYPAARILVADNGQLKARLPGDVKVLDLEFDCGLSRARNALIDHLDTEFLLLLEEDFLFTDETRIDPFVEILDTDHEVGMIGGAMRGGSGRLGLYCLDIDIFRRVLYVQDSTRRMRVTRFGTSYRICDIAWNFGLFRREFLAANRWDDELKVGEHAAYFHQVKLRGEWRVAATPAVVIYHVPDHRTEHYNRHRLRARRYLRQYLDKNGLTDYRRVPPALFHDDTYGKPSVVVLGVGHSGTSILTRMLQAAGWDAPDADQEFAECVWMRNVNVGLIRHGVFDAARALQQLASMPQPWVVKDPRFVFTLNYWTPLFAELENPPALVRIVRDVNDVKRSYLRRGFRGNIHELIDQRLRLCERQYEKWPFARLTVQYEQLASAATLFSPQNPVVDGLPQVWPPGPLGAAATAEAPPVPATTIPAASVSAAPVSAAPVPSGVTPSVPAAVPDGRMRAGNGKPPVREMTADLPGQQPSPAAGIAGWQATIPQDELIEGIGEAIRHNPVARPLVPAWQATIPQDELIEGTDEFHRAQATETPAPQAVAGNAVRPHGRPGGNGELTGSLPGSQTVAPVEFVPGWKAIVPDSRSGGEDVPDPVNSASSQ